MKYELPIAIALLAAGGFLWGWQGGWDDLSVITQNKTRSAAVGGVGESSGTNQVQAGQTKNPVGSATPVQVASFPSHRSTDSAVSQLEVSDKAWASKQDRRLDFSAVPPDAASAEFLKSAGETLFKAPSFRSDLAVQFAWMGPASPIAGYYVHGGQGSGKSKIELQFAGTDNATSVSIAKIYDGRFLYTHVQRAEQQTLEFVDLRRIQETRLSTGMAEPDNPTSWIATGGVASLLENLSAAFQFGPASFTESNQVELCTIEGQWRTAELAELLAKTVDGNLLSPEIQWDRLPPQLPHQIKIELIRVTGLGWFPQRILISQFAKDTSRSGAKGLVKPLALIEFSIPQPIAVDLLEYFNIQTDEVESIDATDSYVTQVEEFGFARQAQIESMVR